MRTLGKPRRKADGSYELPFRCPCCGASRTGQMEVNSRNGIFNCFRCHYSGAMPQGWQTDPAFGVVYVPRAHAEAAAVAGKTSLSDRFPHYVRQEIERRGQEIPWIVHRYGCRWDGERLRWPAGPTSACRRACLPWERPKTLTVGPKGLLGSHLLRSDDRRSESVLRGSGPSTLDSEASRRLYQADDAERQAAMCVTSNVRPGQRIVLTEGDWKAAAIPLPWIGLGLLGTSITDEQAFTLRCSNPRVVLVLLDAGYELYAEIIVTKLSPTPAKVVKCPGLGGPDDIPRHELVNLLLNADR